MFSLKASIFILTLCFALIPRAQSMPECGVCSNPNRTFPSFQAAASTPKTAFGEKKILYIRVNYSDDASEPISMEDAETLMEQVSSFYRTHSYGQCWTSATITPLLEMPSPKSSYFLTNATTGQIEWYGYTVLNDARAIARAAGFEPSDYDFEMVRFNAPFLQSWGNIGYSGAWMVSSHPATTIHELGHNLGLYHSNLWDGSLDGAGTNREYGDPFDVMGNAYYFEEAGLNTIRKSELGWLNDSHAARVTRSGIYRLYAHDTNGPVAGRKYILRIRKDDQRDYWIEKRQRFDMSDDLLQSGVLSYWDNWSESNRGTHLLDIGPLGPVLPIDHLIADPGAGLRVMPLRQAADRSYVEVAVILGDSPLNILPGLLHFAGVARRSYTVRSSSDLRAWSDLGDFSSPSGEIVVPIDSKSSMRFYRVVETSLQN